jgi:hypothetical protein
VVNGGKAPEWTVAEKLASPGFDRRTVQSIASRYTECHTPARTWEDAIGNSVTFPSFFFSFFLSFFLSSFLPIFICFLHKNNGRVMFYILTFDILVEKFQKFVSYFRLVCLSVCKNSPADWIIIISDTACFSC